MRPAALAMNSAALGGTVPRFAIVDTHLHIFDPARLIYPWHGSIPQLDRPFLLPDFDEHRATVDVERMVFLECDVAPRDRVAEAQWVSQCRYDRVAGSLSKCVVEPRGIEPLTSTLRTSRSPN